MNMTNLFPHKLICRWEAGNKTILTIVQFVKQGYYGPTNISCNIIVKKNKIQPGSEKRTILM